MAVSANLQSAIAPQSLKARQRIAASRHQPLSVERAGDAPVDLGCLPRLLAYNLRRAHQTAWRCYVGAIGESKLRPGLFSLLVMARANPGISQIEMGRHLGVDKASIVALLDRLERSNLIERRRSTRDRRCHGLFLTAAGNAELDGLLLKVRLVEKQLAGQFNKSELEQLLGLLRRLYG